MSGDAPHPTHEARRRHHAEMKEPPHKPDEDVTPKSPTQRYTESVTMPIPSEAKSVGVKPHNMLPGFLPPRHPWKGFHV